MEIVRNMETALRTTSREELRKKIDAKDYFFLVETLPATYYREGHLPGALNLPPDKVRELASSVLPDKNAEVIVYCAKLT
jgi:rhodanese-related sulfurtransferase